MDRLSLLNPVRLGAGLDEPAGQGIEGAEGPGGHTDWQQPDRANNDKDREVSLPY